MYKISLMLAILGSITFCAHGSDSWKRKQERQYHNAMTDLHIAQRICQPVSLAIMHKLDPYQRRQAQAHNQQLAAQQAAFTAQAIGQCKS